MNNFEQGGYTDAITGEEVGSMSIGPDEVTEATGGELSELRGEVEANTATQGAVDVAAGYLTDAIADADNDATQRAFDTEGRDSAFNFEGREEVYDPERSIIDENGDIKPEYFRNTVYVNTNGGSLRVRNSVGRDLSNEVPMLPNNTAVNTLDDEIKFDGRSFIEVDLGRGYGRTYVSADFLAGTPAPVNDELAANTVHESAEEEV